MANRIRLNQSLCIAVYEYKRWLFNSRFILIIALIMYIYYFSVKPLINLSLVMGDKLGLFEAYIAVINSKSLTVIIIFIYIVLIADFPKTDSNLLLILTRTNKLTWILGEMLFFFFTSVSFITLVVISSMFLTFQYSDINNDWSNTVVNYPNIFPEKASSFEANLISKELINQLSPFEVCVHSSLLILLYLFSISLLLLLFYLLGKKRIGNAIIVLLVSIGSILYFVETPYMWLLPSAHSLLYLHFTEYYNKPIFEISNSYNYFAVFCFVFFVLCLCLTKNAKIIEMCE